MWSLLQHNKPPINQQPNHQTSNRYNRDIAQGILQRSGIAPGAGYQLGVSKVFLRAGQMAILDKQRTGAVLCRAVPCCAVLCLYFFFCPFQWGCQAATSFTPHSHTRSPLPHEPQPTHL